ncbi:MAG TPA: hypothetical protein PLK12_11825 [Prolixibacteraceae bacterium]|nr:hypothetical protein [Prolixibacteraceae bacterium]
MKIKPDIVPTFLLAALFTGLLAAFLPSRDDGGEEALFWTRKTFAPASFDGVIMGDSRAYRGLSPEVMEKHLPGMKVLNFGYSNGGLNPEMFEAAGSKLDKTSQAKIMVLAVTANCLTGYTRGNEQWKKERFRSREERLERLWMRRFLIRFSPIRLSELDELFQTETPEKKYMNRYHPDGWVESEKFPPDTSEALPSYIKDFTRYKVENAYMDELFRQVKKWSDEGITVVAFRPPVTASMRMLEDTMARYNEYVIKEGIIQAGGHWIDIDPSEYETYDGSHLNKTSALRLSEKMGRELKILLGKE